MTEEEAKAWLDGHGWWQGAAGERLRAFADMVLEESERQNLISAASREHLWARHIVDSAQLLALSEGAGAGEGAWIDLGTGAGFPGMVVACLRSGPVKLIEVRPLRSAFLQRCVDALGLAHVEVVTGKVERVHGEAPAAVISARAYAPLDRLLASAAHLSDEKTLWLLPKGRNGEKELENIRQDWQAMFHVEHSITDPESVVVTIKDLHRPGRGPAPRSAASLRQRPKRAATRSRGARVRS
ncbi:ribosomal RNA small subunit methyltransferase G [Sphingobium sp. SYK-6]|uniref:16S rRNA (guanine(527)-N(7))-methyltransferase RsmG n=1 Tax=Sphingobium sp. (strain NBRC 103272 / SYK-6) TaxID=627192 RepID=UPI000227787D|nr:16S rRNA (guanine(527)-N(7))-methyltransferase RsmG [Sphingobium sp. SYK-6]BAK68579.1 ribosomal RNA small subunit methyltransferase G [Sphingobium sp. SYK-6]